MATMVDAIKELNSNFDGDHAEVIRLKAANDNIVSETAALRAQLKAANDNLVSETSTLRALYPS